MIELMIVVAIIGILAAIAIPNFMAYQAKAKQSEAKVGLGGIFTTATSYFAENSTFQPTTGAPGLNYAPAGNPRYAFTYGTTAPQAINTVAAQFTTPYNCTGVTTVVTVAATAGGFTAGARGNIDSDPTCDEWNIDDTRNLTNTINDVQS